jgi:predicted transcriptional regulator YdeE
METKVVLQPEMSFLGVEQRFESDTEDPGYYNLWFNKFMPKEGQFSKHRIDDSYYALVMNNSTDGSWTYMPSVKIENIQKIPEDMTLRKLKAAQFLEFETTVADIGQKWGQIEELLKSDNSYKRKADMYSYEFYPPNTTKPESKVWIFIPIEEGHDTQSERE